MFLEHVAHLRALAKCNQHIVILKCILRTCNRYLQQQPQQQQHSHNAHAMRNFGLHLTGRQTKTKRSKHVAEGQIGGRGGKGCHIDIDIDNCAAALDAAAVAKIWQCLHFDFHFACTQVMHLLFTSHARGGEGGGGSSGNSIQFRKFMLQLSTAQTKTLVDELLTPASPLQQSAARMLHMLHTTWCC